MIEHRVLVRYQCKRCGAFLGEVIATEHGPIFNGAARSTEHHQRGQASGGPIVVRDGQLFAPGPDEPDASPRVDPALWAVLRVTMGDSVRDGAAGDVLHMSCRGCGHRPLTRGAVRAHVEAHRRSRSRRAARYIVSGPHTATLVE